MNPSKYTDAPDRLLPKVFARSVEQPNGCVLWTGNDKPGGYGQISYRAPGSVKVALYVHRLVFVKLVGPVSGDLQVDHRCHDPETCRPAQAKDCPHRRCVNPDHLVLTTPRENTLRSGARSAANAAKDRCPEGHEYRVMEHADGSTSRRCQPCNTKAKRAEFSRRRAEINERTRVRAAEIRAQEERPEDIANRGLIGSVVHLLKSGFARSARQSAGLSQYDLAELCGSTQTGIWGWETGERRPTGASGAAYANWLLTQLDNIAA